MIRKELPAAVRKTFGKGPMRRLRVAGQTPAVAYGRGKDALALQFETKLLFHELVELQGRNAVLTLNIDDGSVRHVILKEVQSDPVKNSLYHADFMEIDLERPEVFSVPVVFTGKAKGVDAGGLQVIESATVQLKGIPLDIPDECVIDVRQLGIGDKVVAGQITVPEGVTLVSDHETVCVTIAAP